MAARRWIATMTVMNGALDTRRVLIPVAGPMSAMDGPRADATPDTEREHGIRRYRLGRMPLHTRPDPAADRFAHLRRGYD